MTTNSLEERAKQAYSSRISDIRRLHKIDAYDIPVSDEEIEELGASSPYEYGLGMWIVEAGTYPHQRADYICYQLSWGGPSEEFRIYKNGDVEFWYLDWFESACIDVTGDDAKLITDLAKQTFPDFYSKNRCS